jgi:hypothetical protein
MPAKVSTEELSGALENGLWNNPHTMLAITTGSERSTSFYILVVEPEGQLLVADVSRLTRSLFNKLAWVTTGDFERSILEPIEWSCRENYCMLKARLRAWHLGQRYTVFRPLVINSDGSVTWQ